MDQISAAVQAARYNEAVVVNVEDEEGVTRELVLVATIDAANGGVVWQNASNDGNGNDDTDNDNDVGIRRHLRTKRWVLPMLNDSPRNEMYHGAIQQACKEAVAKHKSTQSRAAPSFYILDIGSGTGLLAMMASKYAEEALGETDETNVKVLSLEMASAMARLARQTVASNGFTNIEIREEHSCEIILQDDQRRRAMLCTSELLESGLLGEGILPALRDAWDRHLHPDAIMVPQRARVYAQLLDSKKLIQIYAGPAAAEIDLGKDLSGLRMSTSSGGNSDPLLGNVPGVLVPIHATCLFRDDSDTRVLSDPIMVMDFDFTSRSAMPDQDGRSRSHSIVAKASGTAHGVLFWWELDLWDGLTYSTECGKQPWQDHWQQCLYVFTNNLMIIPVEQGKGVCLTCHHTDTKISFSVNDTNNDSSAPKRAKTVLAKLQLSPLRSSILASTDRIATMQRSIAFNLSTIDLDSLVLDISDFSLCGVLAALSGAKRVISLESSSGELPMMSAQLAQIGNQLPRDGASWEILQCHSEQLTLEVLGGPSPAKLVVAEPYYEMLEGWHLQECINYYFLLQFLKNRGVLDVEHLSIPSHARIMACAIQSSSIYDAYRGCGNAESDDKSNSAVCGFDHSIVNKFAARYHEHDLSIPIWQYEHTELTGAFEIAKLDYTQLRLEGNGEWREAPALLKAGGIWHGLLFWIEYGYPADKQQRQGIISTKAGPYIQGVRLLETPISVDNESIFRCRLTISGDLKVGHEIHTIELEVGKVRST